MNSESVSQDWWHQSWWDTRVLISRSQSGLCCYIRTWKTEQTVEKTSVSFTPLGGSRYEVRGFASHLHHLRVEGKGKEANLAALNSLKLALMYPWQWSPHDPNMSHQAPPPHLISWGIKFSTRVSRVTFKPRYFSTCFNIFWQGMPASQAYSKCGLYSVWSETNLEESKPCLLITRYWFKLKWNPFIREERNRNRFFKMITEYLWLHLNSLLLIQHLFLASSVAEFCNVLATNLPGCWPSYSGRRQSLHYISLETGERRCVGFLL